MIIQRADSSVVRQYAKALAEDADDHLPKDPRIEEAERLESWAAALPSEKAQTAILRAQYLRAAVRYNFDA